MGATAIAARNQRRDRHVSAEGAVRAGPLMGLADLLRELGHDPRPPFARVGLTPGDLGDPDAEISFVLAGKLLAACVAESGCPHLGLLLGQRIALSSLGVPGYLVYTASDVRAALIDLVHHFDLHDRGAVLTLDIVGKTARLGYAIYLPQVPAVDQIYDLSIAVECNILRGLCGSRWNPREVRLARGAPVDVVPYEQFFRAPIRFDADQSAVVFPSGWLDHPVASSNAELHRHLEMEAEDLHATQPRDIVGQVRGLLRGSFATRKADAQSISRQLGLNQRTLHRRLRRAGTNFREELAAVRYQTARELLANTTLPLSRIAAALNYGDTSAFIRAFKKWSGVPPTAWRRRYTRR